MSYVVRGYNSNSAWNVAAEFVFLRKLGSFVDWTKQPMRPSRKELLRRYLRALDHRNDGFTPAELVKLREHVAILIGKEP